LVKVLLGGLGTFFLAAFGVDALFYRESFSIGTSPFSGGGSFLFAVHGSTASVMGIAWLNSAVAVFVWFVLRPAFPTANSLRVVRNVAVLIAGLAFFYVACRGVWTAIMGGQL
jgi:hypothetical protein